MKKYFRRYRILLLALLLFTMSITPNGLSLTSAENSGEDQEFNLFEVAGDISESFIAETTELIENNWEEDYLTSISMKLGEAEMLVDGSDETISNPAVVNNGEIMLPIVDIANAVGADVDVDETTGNITIDNDGDTTIIELPLVDQYLLSLSSKRDVDGGKNRTDRSLLLPASEAEEALALDVHRSGERITITKPYQLKQILLYVKDGKQLKQNYNADECISNDQGLYFLLYSSEKLTRKAYEAFLSDPDIVYVTLNQAVKTTALPDRWGAERISADVFKTHLISSNKAVNPVNVAVLDTGVDVSHPFLQGRTVTGYNIINNSDSPYDIYGHGTHVAGTIVDCTTPNVKIMPVKVLADNGNGSWVQVCMGIKQAADSGARVINMSLGGPCYENNCIEKQAIDYATGRGVTTVAAAGNDSANAVNYCPARLKDVITVSAFDIRDMPADFTNYGAVIDVAAPGVDILSCIPGGGYKYSNGTSMAAPYVTAAVAMLKSENINAAPAQLKTAVRNIAKPVMGVDPVYYGAGLLDFKAFFGAIPPESPGVKLSRHFIDVETITDKYSPYQLWAKVTPPSAYWNLVYSSSNPKIAICDSNGVVHVKGNGTAIITATVPSVGYSDSCTVSVNVNESAFWTGSAAEAFAGGNGTKTSPYQIATPGQLALLAQNARLQIPGGGLKADEYFALTADIDLNGKDWVSIGWNEGNDENPAKGISAPFLGHFNGNGFVIKNMKQGNAHSGLPKAEQGLFEYICGEVRDLGVTGAEQKSPSSGKTAILAQRAGPGAVIENCHTSGKTAGYGFIAEISGEPNGAAPLIKNCYSSAESLFGQFANYCSYANINNCYAYGSSVFIGEASDSANIVNSFVVGTGSLSVGVSFINRKRNAVISKCYVSGINLNYLGIPFGDNSPATTDIGVKPLEFFKDINNYTNPVNWNRLSPWDFNDTWGVDAGVNYGLPYLKSFNVIVGNAETPIIRYQPNDQAIETGAAAALAVTAAVSKGNLSYQWYENSGKINSGGYPIAGATNSVYYTPALSAGTRYYYCVITNTDDTVSGSKTASVVSNAVAVTVNETINWDLGVGKINSKNSVVSVASEVHKYVFTAPVSGRYSFSVTNKAAALKYLDAYFFEDAGSILTYKYDSGVGVSFTYDLTQGQTYRLVLQGGGGIGAYTVNITVPGDIPVISITVSLITTTLNVGETINLTAAVLPGNATDKTIVWSSSNPAVAEVNADGVVNARGSGICNIYALNNNFPENPSYGICYLTVTAAKDDSTTDWLLETGKTNSRTGVIHMAKDINKLWFIAPVSGTYKFFTSDKAPALAYLDAYLYDNYGKSLISRLDFGSCVSFSYDLIEGQRYCLDLKGLLGTGNYTINITAPA